MKTWGKNVLEANVRIFCEVSSKLERNRPPSGSLVNWLVPLAYKWGLNWKSNKHQKLCNSRTDCDLKHGVWNVTAKAGNKVDGLHVSLALSLSFSADRNTPQVSVANELSAPLPSHLLCHFQTCDPDLAPCPCSSSSCWVSVLFLLWSGPGPPSCPCLGLFRGPCPSFSPSYGCW